MFEEFYAFQISEKEFKKVHVKFVIFTKVVIFRN